LKSESNEKRIASLRKTKNEKRETCNRLCRFYKARLRRSQRRKSHRNHRKHGKILIDKNRKNPFFCLVALSEPCAKCYVLVFKSKLLRQCHNPHHITSFLQALEGKTPPLTSSNPFSLDIQRTSFRLYSLTHGFRGKTVTSYENENF